MFSETELPLCSLVGNFLYIRCFFFTGVLTTLNFPVDLLSWCKPRIVQCIVCVCVYVG